MSAVVVRHRPSVLAWTGSRTDDERFRRIYSAVLAVCLLFILLINIMPPPKADIERKEELPPRFAKLLLEHEPPPPLIPKPEPVQAPVQKTKPDVTKPPVRQPEPKKAPVPEARQPVPDKPPGEILENARRKASGVGLLAMKDEIADLHGAPMAVQLKNDIKQGPGVGTGVGAGVGAGNGLGIPTRNLITSNATRGSGGINTGGFSRDTGGGGLAGRSTTLVAGVAGGGGGGGFGGGGGGGGGSVQHGGSGKASRSIEEIRLVFDRNKGALYSIYMRAMRDDPTLQGKVVVELKIAPSGQVLECHIVSSELKAEDMERKLVARIRQFDFGAKDVDTMNLTFPLDFLPS